MINLLKWTTQDVNKGINHVMRTSVMCWGTFLKKKLRKMYDNNTKRGLNWYSDFRVILPSIIKFQIGNEKNINDNFIVNMKCPYQFIDINSNYSCFCFLLKSKLKFCTQKWLMLHFSCSFKFIFMRVNNYHDMHQGMI